MARRKKKQRYSAAPTQLDPETQEILDDAAENKAALSEKQRKDRERIRVQVYDVPASVKEAIDDLATDEDTSSSQLAALLLAYGLKEVQRGNGEISHAIQTGKSPSRTPKFAWNVDLPEDWLVAIEETE